MKNIVLLTIDTLRFDAWGCNSGATPSRTPFLDSIQKNCLRFDRAYSGGPYTQAAFPGILSSSHYLEYGKTRGKCPPQRQLISETMHHAGYATAAFHSNAYLCGFFGWNRGWDVFYDSMDAPVTETLPYVRAHAINAKAASWLRGQGRDQSKPFFLWVHYMDMHEPYMPQPRYLRQIDPELSMTEGEMFRIFKEVVLKRKVDDPAEVALAKKLYDAHMIEVDDAAKQLFGALEQNGFLDDTTVIVTADHGEEFAEHGGMSHDGKMFDELVHVPLCIFDRSFTEKTIPHIVSTLDISPTIAYLANAAAPASWQGQSLLPLDAYDAARGAFGEAIDKHGPKEIGDEKEVHYYVENDLKIVYHQQDDRWDLFHLADDPKEQHSLFGDDTRSEYLMKKIIPRIERYHN